MSSPPHAQAPEAAAQVPLPTARRRHPRSGVEVSALGLGGAYLGRTATGWDDDLAVATVLAALDAGLRYLDTSPYYGDSERRIGAALDAHRAQGGKREDLTLSTKTGTRTRPADYSADATFSSVELSLQLLQTAYLDIVLIHDPTSLDQALAANGALRALERLREQGVVKAIGLGVRDHALHRQAIATGAFDFCLTFGDFNLLSQTAGPGVAEVAAAAGTGVINATVLAGGLLRHGAADAPAVNGWSRQYYDLDHLQRLRQWCATQDIDLFALNLQWCLRQPQIMATLTGAASPRELQQTLSALTTALPATIWHDLKTTFGL